MTDGIFETRTVSHK